MLKTTLLTEGLKDGITFAFHAVSSRSTLPVLSNFLIEVRRGRLVVSATDLEIGILVDVPAKTEREGRVLVPAKTFVDIVGSINSEKLDLEEQGSTLVLRAKGVKTNFPTQKTEEYPVILDGKKGNGVEMSRREFEKSLSRVVFAAAQDTTRPALSGVLFKSAEGGVSMVATDGYRLSLKSNKKLVAGKGSAEMDLLISSRVVKEVLGAKKEGDRITMYSVDANNQVVFEFDGVSVVGRLIEAEYPDYQKIIPEDFETSVRFDRVQALSAVRSCSVIAREAANIVRMRIGKKDVVFSATATSAGENEVVIDAVTEGSESEIAFNAKYLLDFLSNIDEDNLIFQMTGPLRPGVFRVDKDSTFLHLIMPIRVQE